MSCTNKQRNREKEDLFCFLILLFFFLKYCKLDGDHNIFFVSSYLFLDYGFCGAIVSGDWLRLKNKIYLEILSVNIICKRKKLSNYLLCFD